MAPPRSRAAPSKRRAAPPNPSPDPDPTAVDEFNLHLLHAASEGDLRLLKRLVRALDKSRRDPREVLEAAKEDGVGALHIAARNGSVPVCRYLVEEIGVDVDIVGDESWILPVISSIVGPIQKKLATIGSPHFIMLLEGDCEMVELLLAKGVPVDPVSFGGTPLHVAAMGGHDEIVQILLENNADAGADVNDCLITPLAAGAEIKGLTACLELLLEAGADPNVPDPSGRFPIEIAAMNGSREDVEILFPVTYCIPTVPDWSIDGIIRHAAVSMKQVEHVRRIADLKSVAVKAIKRNNYLTAAKMYSTAMEHDHHDATLFSKRSLCWLRMGDGHKALQDALACREMRPGWPKGCYQQGAALMLLKDYGGACNAFLDATKLDPWSRKIEAALRGAMNSLKTSHGATKAT